MSTTPTSSPRSSPDAPPHATDRPELLAPAGDWDALRAAVANGADAVYFGLSDFNARHRATNFTRAELPEVMAFLHGRNVRGYVTCNTLIFSDELPQLVEYVRELALARVDAVIVQDLGLLRLIRRLAPGLAVHASTQMTLTDARGIELVRGWGAARAILARELSVPDLRAIRTGTDLPIEVFVHGALCVAYSGQCLTSEALGGRSANRGQCAQACRLPYDLIVDGAQRDLGDQAYLLSPQDLAAPDLIAELVDVGVSCFKIEGRLKSAQYVAATTQVYGAALAAALADRPFELTRRQELDLQQSFSRGFSHGFLDGVNHQVLVQGRFPKKRGIRIGTVQRHLDQGVVVALEGDWPAEEPPLKSGDGVVFDEGHPEQDEQGGRLWSVVRRGAMLDLNFGPGEINWKSVRPGAIVWKTDDPAMNKRLTQSFNRDVVAHRRPLDVSVRAVAGEPLTVHFSAHGVSAAVQSEAPLAVAQKHPLTHALLRDQFNRLGDTPFELGRLELHGADGLVAEGASLPVMAPKSVLNDLRRRGVAELLAAESRGDVRLHDGALSELRDAALRAPSESPSMSQLHVLTRTLAQLQAVLAWRSADGLPRPASVLCDFEDPRGYAAAVELARAAGVPIGLATLRVIKPGEDGWLRQIALHRPDFLLVRNLSALSFYQAEFPELTLHGDGALNVANELTAALFCERGLQRLVPSFDLNWPQLAALLQRFPPGRFEAVIHQHMPMFHMEHCVFAHTLSNGKDHRDCGRPCETHRVDLRDRVGELLPLIPDVGCRNTVFNSVAQSAAEYIPRMQELGLRHFRVELLREEPRDVAILLNRYTRLLAGLESGRAAWTELRVLDQLGVTRGTLSS